MSGLQTWLALPDDKEEIAPDFSHTKRGAMPLIDIAGATGSVVIGDFAGLRSPVKTFTDTLYADLSLTPGAKFPFPADHEERAIYILSGSLEVAGVCLPRISLLAFAPRRIHAEGWRRWLSRHALRRCRVEFTALYLVEFRFVIKRTHRAGQGRVENRAFRHRPGG